MQAPLSMGFFRQKYWNGLPFPPPENLPDSGIEPASLMSLAFSGGFFTTSATWEAKSEADQSWDFFGRDDAEAETPVLWPLM